MAIEINGFQNPAAQGTGDGSRVSSTQTDASQNPQDAGSTARNDTVNLTDAARQLNELENQVKAQPVVDNQRVEATRQAIAGGTYEVNAGAVAHKLLQFEAYLPSR